MKIFQFQSWQCFVLLSLCFSFWVDLCVAKQVPVGEPLKVDSCKYPCECEKASGNEVCASSYETFPNQCFLDLYNYNETNIESHVTKLYDGPCETIGKSYSGNPADQDTYDQYDEIDDSEDYDDEYGHVNKYSEENYPVEIFTELQRPSQSNSNVQPVPLVQSPPFFHVQPSPYTVVKYQPVPVPAPDQDSPTSPDGFDETSEPASDGNSEYIPLSTTNESYIPVASNYSSPIEKSYNLSPSKNVSHPKESVYSPQQQQPPVQQQKPAAPYPKNSTKYDRDTTTSPTDENGNDKTTGASLDEGETTSSTDVPMTHPPVESGQPGATHGNKYPLPPVPAPGYIASTKNASQQQQPVPVLQTGPPTIPYKNPVQIVPSQPEHPVLTHPNPNPYPATLHSSQPQSPHAPQNNHAPPSSKPAPPAHSHPVQSHPPPIPSHPAPGQPHPSHPVQSHPPAHPSRYTAPK